MFKQMAMALIASSISLTSLGAQTTDTANPGSVFLFPEPELGQIGESSDNEIITELEFFTSRGYKSVDWIANSPIVDKVYENVAFPDYVKRAGGEKPPYGYVIEIATGMITKQGFKDLIVVSRAPNDCDETGCLFQIYSLIGEEWIKRIEFKAVDLAVKDGEGAATYVAGVGYDEYPSKIYYWNGQFFE